MIHGLCVGVIAGSALIGIVMNAIAIDFYTKREDIRRLRRVNKWLLFIMAVILIAAVIIVAIM